MSEKPTMEGLWGAMAFLAAFLFCIGYFWLVLSIASGQIGPVAP